MAYFINRTFRKSGIFEKADPGPPEKADPLPKFTIGQKHLYDKLEVAVFKYDNNFYLKLQPKSNKIRHF